MYAVIGKLLYSVTACGCCQGKPPCLSCVSHVTVCACVFAADKSKCCETLLRLGADPNSLDGEANTACEWVQVTLVTWSLG